MAPVPMRLSLQDVPQLWPVPVVRPMNKPQRRNHLTIDIGADDHQALIDVLRDLLWRCEAKEILISEGNGASGGWTSGYWYSMTVDPEMDGDRYRKELAEWIEAERRAGE